MDQGHKGELVLFVFNLLFLNGESTAHLPLTERKARLKRLFSKEINGLRYIDMSLAMALSFVSTPASSAWRARFRSEPPSLARQATEAFGSTRSA